MVAWELTPHLNVMKVKETLFLLITGMLCCTGCLTSSEFKVEDLKDGDILELKEDVFHACFTWGLVPQSRDPFPFTVEQWQNDSKGIEETHRASRYIRGVVKKGTLIEFKKVKGQWKDREGNQFNKCGGYILSGEFKTPPDKKYYPSLGSILYDRPFYEKGRKPTCKYLKKVHN